MKKSKIRLIWFNNIAFLLMACGSKSHEELAGSEPLSQTDINKTLLSLNLINSKTQAIKDPSEPTSLVPLPVDPYWVKSLEMEEFEEVAQYFEGNPRVIYFAFPQVMPTYFDVKADEKGWQPVTVEVEKATSVFLDKIADVLNVKFEETDDIKQPYVISLMSNNKGGSDAYAYFPSSEFSIGSDVFISNKYLNPQKLSENKTNYDYEIIVHEIGHALGLKHSFAPLGKNEYFLPQFEDTSRLTAMTYSEDSHFFNGDFRPFDYLALVQYYGINPNFMSSNDIYSFNASSGVYIIDAGGHDEINTSNSNDNAFIDLRENSHSFLNIGHDYVSAPFQMTISQHSVIEDVITGDGDDHIVGNDVNNYISTNGGDDIIIASEGSDIIEPGTGYNRLDLFEEVSVNDFIVFDPSFSSQFVEAHNFDVTGVCDVLVLDCDIDGPPKISPVQKISNITNFNQYDIYRITDLDMSSGLDNAFYQSSTDKIILSNTNDSQDFDTQVHVLDASRDSIVPLFTVASIETNGANLSDWSAENFLLI